MLALLLILAIGFLLPQKIVIPVVDASSKDWNPDTFWYYPWGKSVTHKGVDIFAERGRTVITATGGIVVYVGELGRGGNCAIILGPKWRFHYYAHLDRIEPKFPRFVKRGTDIGTVGKTGNAANTPPHLHYTIISAIPVPWLADKAPQGWKKMFYMNPLAYFDVNRID